MGLDGSPKLEEWLVELCPVAFFYALPVNFVAAVVICDLTAMLRTTWGRLDVTTGTEFGKALLKMAKLLSYAKKCDRENTEEELVPPVRLATQHHCTAHERMHTPELVPDIPADKTSRIEWRIAQDSTDEKMYQLRVTHDAELCLLLDDPTHIPYNRSMTHEKRYGHVQKLYLPLTHEHLRKHRMLVRDDRPLPGYDENGTPIDTQIMNAVKRADNTPIVKMARTVYGVYALRHALRKQHSCDACKKLPCACAKQQHVLIDAISDYPMLADEALYRGRDVTLADLPATWGRNVPYTCTRISLTDGASEQLPPTRIGETDLKILHYIESAPLGSDVLVRMSDADVLYILLQNAARWVDPVTGRFRWRVFLDMDSGLTNMNHKRLMRRYVCINTLAVAFTQHARVKWPAMQAPLQILHVLGLLTGSDYTQKFFRKGGVRVLKAFNNGGWEMLSTFLKPTVVTSDWEPGRAASELLAAFDVDEDAGLMFLKALFVDAIRSKPAGKRASINMNWDALRALVRIAENEKKAHMPSEDAARVLLRQCVWVVHYVMNTMLVVGGAGAFPTPHLWNANADAPSVWGWQRARRSTTEGTGLERNAKRKYQSHPAHLALEERRAAKRRRTGSIDVDPIVCSRAPAVCSVKDLMAHLHLEAALRVKLPDVRINPIAGT